MTTKLRIAQVAPPLERVPPRGYGGTERVIFELVRELVDRGHHVTTFASGDSELPGDLVPTAPQALRPSGYGGDPSGWFVSTIQSVMAHETEFDIIHSHLEWYSPLLAQATTVPIVSTFHGRLDLPWARAVLTDAAGGYVAISEAQASTHPDMPWAGVVHNGLRLDNAPFDRRRGDDLCFVGRVAPEKGIVDALEIARLSGRRLRIAAKIGTTPYERGYYEDVFRPALAAAGSDVEFVGELEQADRDRLIAESYASLMPGSWPEPFGLVAIESLACGTPVIARRVGALPEIIRDGVDGFFGDDETQLAYAVDRVDTLDREAISRSVRERFSATRMAEGYEAVYRSIIGSAAPTATVAVTDERRTGGPLPTLRRIVSVPGSDVAGDATSGGRRPG